MKKTNWTYDFPPVSAKAWKQQIQVDLKGADYNEHLIWESPDHINVKPFYNAEDLKEAPALKINTPDSWYVGQEIFVQSVSAANKKALDALARGAESIVFNLPTEEIKIQELFKGMDVSVIPVHLNLQFLSPRFTASVFEFCSKTRATIYVHTDVLGNLARTGNWYNSLEKDLQLHNEIQQQSVSISRLSIDASLFQNAGASRVQQLAYALSQANEYLNLIDNHKNPGQLNEPVFKVAVDSNYFFEIAKLRALRILWATLAKEYGFNQNCLIIASPTKRNKTIYEYNANLLRTTTECMAAVLGGADMVCNLPYDSIYHKDNEFGERIARNQLLILKNESYFDAVSNPADGAYYIETLTHQLAEKALALFKEIEASGGFLKALKNHNIQKKIKESAVKEQLHFENGQEILVGSNKYVNDKDTMKDTIEIYPFLKTHPKKTLIEPILERRIAESIEQNRLDNE